jgi:NAD(P)-dependent dehydrogenase (short-subunit alcohol dehydrogenase family)
MAVTAVETERATGRRLEGKVAIVTGGASGLGLASAQRFAEEGARVVCVDLDGAAAEQAAAGIGDAALGLAADVTDEAALERAVAATLERFGRVDVLYANAGIPGTGQVHEISLAEWQRVIDVNLTGVFLSARAVLPPMLAQGAGSLVLQASVGGLTGIRSLPAYAAAKGGVVALTKQMAADYSERGIRVNAICPGTVRTPLVEATYVGFAGSEEAAKEALARRDRDYPMGRLGAVEDVANLALFLASDESRWIAGGIYTVDGGMTAVSQWSPAAQ